MSGRCRRLEGVVDDLQVSAGQREFLQTHQKQGGATIAAALAASGAAGAAMGAAAAITGPGDAVEFFTCHIGDSIVSGAFSKVTFKNGDAVVAAVTTASAGGFVAHAIARRDDKLLWIEPHCSRGMIAHLFQSIRVGFWVFLAFAAVGLPILWLAWNDDPQPRFFDFVGSVVGSVAVIAGAYYSVRFYFQWRNVARQAEEIFRALGFACPAKVSLPRENVRFSRAQGIAWPYETDGPWIYRCELASPLVDE